MKPAVPLVVLLSFAGCGTPRSEIDTSFGTNGVAILDVNSSLDEARAVGLQSDGKILVGGRTFNTDWDFLVTRLNTDGTLDTTFGTNGFAVTDFGSADDTVEQIVLGGDDGFFAIGTSEETTRGTSRFAVAKFDGNGAAAADFGTGGKLTTVIGSSPTRAYSGVLQSDGKLIVGGETTVSGQLDFALVRYSSDGTLDTTFDVDGKLTLDFSGSDDGVRGVVLLDGGDIVAGGYSVGEGKTGFATAKVDTEGKLDPSFATLGQLRLEGTGEDRAHSVTLDARDRIVLVGTSGSAIPQPSVARLENDSGSLDTTLGENGFLLPTVPDGKAFSAHSVVHSGSELIVVGNRLGAASNLGLIALSALGRLDASLGERGILEVDKDFGEQTGEAAALQTDGKVIAVGTHADGLNRDLLVTRLQP